MQINNVEDFSEEQISDLIDELWDHLDGQPWIDPLIEARQAGMALRSIAIMLLRERASRV